MRTFVKLKPGASGLGARLDSRKFSEAMHQREIQTWRPFRLFGVFTSFCALSFTTIAICNKFWTVGKGYHAGIWDVCFHNATRPRVEVCMDKKPYWQNAVIGLLIFSVAFGFLATVLSICGVCTATLPKKIYYYHSAGEIYLICALACTAALIVYPVAIEVEQMSPHSYGVGYGLGWGSAFFFFASAMCMCLDDLVRTLARGLCRCCDRKDPNDTRV